MVIAVQMGENNILIDSSFWDSTAGWEVINAKI